VIIFEICGIWIGLFRLLCLLIVLLFLVDAAASSGDAYGVFSSLLSVVFWQQISGVYGWAGLVVPKSVLFAVVYSSLLQSEKRARVV
jgi:hypothetical protein